MGFANQPTSEHAGDGPGAHRLLRYGDGSLRPAGGLTLRGSFHPSRQNPFTGKLTEALFDAIFTRPRELL